MASHSTPWRTRTLTALSSLLLAAGAVVALSPPAHAAANTATFVKATWGNNFQIDFTVKNGGTTTLSNWKVEFDLPAGNTISSSWDATLTQSGNHRTFTNKDYNGTLNPGATATFGFIGTGTGVLTNCLLNGALCAGGPADVTPPTAPTNLAVSGSPTSSSVALTWSGSTDNVSVTGYRVFNGTAQAATSTGTSATVTELQPNTRYTFTVRAVDAAGNLSANSGPVSVTTANGPVIPPAGGKVAPYVDMGAWPTPSLTALKAGGGAKNYTAAFITAAGCKATWFNAFDPRTAWAKDQFDAIRAGGGIIKISFGGASGVEIAQACTTVASTAAEYNAVVNAYNATHLDFDIEGGAVADTAIDRRSQAIAQVQRAHPGLKISLTLPVMPDGLTANGLNVVRSAINAGVDLDVVNGMAMDYGQGNIDMGAAANKVGQSLHDQLKPLYPSKTDAQLWAMVGITPMLGKNDDASTFSLANARTLVATSTQRHVGFLSYWEMTRDRNACNGSLVECTNVPQAPYDFTKIFAPFNG